MKSLVVANLEKMGVEAKTGISFPRNSLLGVRDMLPGPSVGASPSSGLPTL